MAIITRTVHNASLVNIDLFVPGYDTIKPTVVIAPSATLDLFTVLTTDELETIQNQLASLVAAGDMTVIATVDTTTFNPVGVVGGMTALTGDVTASGSGSVVATLATVNSNVGSFTNSNITVNAKGLITAAANGAAPTTYSAGTGLTLTGTTFSQTVPTVIYSAGTGLTLTGTVFSQTTPSVSPSVVLSAATHGGAAAEEVAVAGLLTTSTIWSVTQQVTGGAALPLTGWTNVINGEINLTYSADMGPGARVLVVFVP